MKKEWNIINTISDIASLAIDCGNGNIITYGKENGEDGSTYVAIFDNLKECDEYCTNLKINKSKVKFIGTARFNKAHVLYSDCAGINGQEIPEEEKIYTLNGRYYIQTINDIFFFTKIED